MDNNKIQKNMRKCLACGEVHPMQICPLIQKKWEIILNSQREVI